MTMALARIIFIVSILSLLGNYILYNMYTHATSNYKNEQLAHEKTKENLLKEKKLIETLQDDKIRIQQFSRKLKQQLERTSIQAANLQKQLVEQTKSTTTCSAELAVDLIRRELSQRRSSKS